MKTYVEGQEIIEGSGIVVIDDGVLEGIEQCDIAIKFPSGQEVTALFVSEVDAIASLGEQIESLKKQVPTEWRTGVPDFANMHEMDVIEWRKTGSMSVYAGTLADYREASNPDNWVGEEHRIIPYVAQPKTLTVDDLPKREDLEWGSQIFREHHPESGSRVGINAYVACSDVGITFWANGTTEHAAVEAALAAVNAGKLDQFLNGGAK